MNLLDTLSSSPHLFCRKLIEATKENSNFDLRVSRVKLVPYPQPRQSELYPPTSPARVALSGDISPGNRALGFNEKLRLRDRAQTFGNPK